MTYDFYPTRPNVGFFFFLYTLGQALEQITLKSMDNKNHITTQIIRDPMYAFFGITVCNY